MEGWVKLHRKLLESPVFSNPELLKIWLWCLLKASHKEHRQMVGMQEITLNEGQFIFGRKKAAIELNLTESKIYRAINKLEKMGNLNIKPNSKFSVVTIENWGIYQNCIDTNEQQSEQQMNNKRTTSEQQVNTNKNVKNDNNVKNDKNSTTTKKDPILSAEIKNQVSTAWNNLGLSQLMAIENRREKMLNARIKKYGLEKVLEIINGIRTSDFLMGRTAKPFKITFDWVVNPNNFVKIAEGDYINRGVDNGKNRERNVRPNIKREETAIDRKKREWVERTRAANNGEIPNTPCDF